MNGTSSVTLLLQNGVLRPLPAPGAEVVPEHRGRKSRVEAYAIVQRHNLALRELGEHEDRYGVGVPLQALSSSRPLQATFGLWRAGASLGEYLSPATFLLHRKQIRNLTGIDISIAYTHDQAARSCKAQYLV